MIHICAHPLPEKQSFWKMLNTIPFGLFNRLFFSKVWSAYTSYHRNLGKGNRHSPLVPIRETEWRRVTNLCWRALWWYVVMCLPPTCILTHRDCSLRHLPNCDGTNYSSYYSNCPRPSYFGHLFNKSVMSAITVNSAERLLDSNAALAFDVNWGPFVCFTPKTNGDSRVAWWGFAKGHCVIRVWSVLLYNSGVGLFLQVTSYSNNYFLRV